MSRIGKKPILVPEKVIVEISETTVNAKGPKGELSRDYDGKIISIVQNDNSIVVSLLNPTQGAYFGLMRQLVNNIVVGVSEGFDKKLEINGVGYRAQVQGKKLILNVGYSHPVEMPIPETITVTVDDNTKITVHGPNKELVGQFSAKIRKQRPPEPYQGKGIKYSTETIRRKVGKTGA